MNNNSCNKEYYTCIGGGIIEVLCFRDKNGKFHGEYKESWEGSQWITHGYYKNGMRHGEYKYWEKDGRLRKHCFYKNGKLHGEEWMSQHSGNLSLYECDMGTLRLYECVQ